MKYNKGLIIGRFQPLHKGHIYLIRQALTEAESLTIAIGSSNTTDRKNNPFSVDRVRTMIHITAQKEGWVDRINKIIELPDFPDDDEWVQYVIEHAGDFEVVVSNNDWVTHLMRTAGYPIIEPRFYKRHIYEGKKIRAQMRKRGEIK